MDLVLDTIHAGDCLKLFRRLPDGIIDLAFADPPFNIGYDYDVYQDKKQAPAYLDWSRRWLGEVARVLKPAGTFWLAIGDEYAAELKLIATNDHGFTCRSWVIWYYTFGVHCTKKFTRSHAHLFHLVKDGGNFTFNEDAIAVPSARQLVYADSRADPAGRMPDDTWVLRPQDLPGGFSAMESTWYFPRVAGTFKERSGFHGCQMPEQLLGRIIRACSHPGEIVLDPFAGSGTTLVTAKKLGRRWLGFELSEDYTRRANVRIAQVKVAQSLQGSAEPVMSAPRTPGLAGKVWLRAGVRRAIIEAYLAAADGWSSDRVIADPALNEKFRRECRDLGLPGGPADWNQALIRLRKMGLLKHLAKPRRTRFSELEMDPFLFASEIALKQRSDATGLSLDDILCDPEEAEKLDAVARRFAPGFSSLHYRWGALAVRKHVHQWRESIQTLHTQLKKLRLSEFIPLSRMDCQRWQGKAGVFLAGGTENQFLYAGETRDLGKSLTTQMQTEGWQEVLPGMEIGILELGEGPRESRHGFKAWLVNNYFPQWNYWPGAKGGKSPEPQPAESE